MTDLDTVDYFTDAAVALDPYAYLGQLVAERPVWQEPRHGVVMVTGYEEILAVLREPGTFSSCNLVAGPDFKLPVPFEGDDVTELVAEYRESYPQNDQIVTADPPSHTAQRALLMGLITPKRLKENEEFMWRLADRELARVIPKRTTEFINDFAQPYTLLVVADLLGVPETDHPALLRVMGVNPDRMPGAGSYEAGSGGHNSLEPLYDYFVEKIEQRRAKPGDDVLTGMSLATFPDGSTPEPIEVARIASNLFSAGQETTVRLIGTVLQLIGDVPGLQGRLRANRDLIPRFIEEAMRIEGPVKGDFRLALKSTTLGGVDIKAGSTIMILNGAGNRDPRQFERPDELQIERPNARRHIGFGHGIHTCPGAPLARSEVRVCLERLFDRTSDIAISESAHGPIGQRRYAYMQTFMFRGLKSLSLDITPAT